MSGPLKKARAVYPLENYVPEDEEYPQDDLIGKIINVDFEAFKAEDGDFHGIKRLLLQSFRSLDVDASGIADIIISQNYVGSVVKQVSDDDDDDDDDDDEMEDEDEIFGVSTVINLTSRKDEEPVSKLRSALVEMCQKYGTPATNTLVRQSLGNESKHVGLLISERLVNLPPQFALPIFDSMLKEIAAANKRGMAYDFAYLILISKIYKEEKKKPAARTNEVMWSNAEEEIFDEESLASFEYSVKGDTGLTGIWEEDDAQFSPWRKVLILEAQKLPLIVNKIRQEV